LHFVKRWFSAEPDKVDLQDGMGSNEARSTEPSWTAIQEAALQVVLLSRREDGFWPLPTTLSEVSETYADVGTLEHKLRSANKFGSPSITVSFNALAALKAGLGEVPRETADLTLRQIDSHRGAHGGYGTPVPRMGKTEVNAVPRHTAMAIMAHLEFNRTRSLENLRLHVEPSIDWLLLNQLKAGGWPYDRTSGREMLGYVSTASSICAFQTYLDMFEDTARSKRKRIITAISKALVALAKAQKGGIWNGDGSPPDNQVRDAAFALRLLLKGDKEGLVVKSLPDFLATIDEMIVRFSSIVVAGGWPKRPHESASDFAATVSALFVIQEAGNPAKIEQEKLLAFEATLLENWQDSDVAPLLTAWNWQCLSILASRFAGPITGTRAEQLRANCGNIIEKSLKQKLRRRDFLTLDKRAAATASFALAGSDGFDNVGVLKRVFGVFGYASKKVGEIGLEQLIAWTLAGLVAFAIAQRQNVLAFLK
jgi:hypothetical protein